MSLSKEDIAEILELVDARAAARGDGKSELQKKLAAKKVKIKADAFKTETHAHYVVGEQGAYREGKRYRAGEVIKVPLEEDPSHTWRPASEKGLSAAARAAKLKVDEAAELVAEASEDEAEPEVSAAPKKPAKGAKKPAKGARAADQDVA